MDGAIIEKLSLKYCINTAYIIFLCECKTTKKYQFNFTWNIVLRPELDRNVEGYNLCPLGCFFVQKNQADNERY